MRLKLLTLLILTIAMIFFSGCSFKNQTNEQNNQIIGGNELAGNDNKVAIISLLFSNDEVDLTELKIIYSDSPEHISQNGDMRVEVVDRNDAVISSSLFWNPRKVLTEDEFILLDEASITITTRLSFNETFINLYDESNNLKLQIDMNQYINNFCTFADGRCDPDCPARGDVDC